MTLAAQQRAQNAQILGATAAGQQFGDNSQPTPEVHRELARLHEALNQLDNANVALFSRLASALATQAPVGALKEKPPEEITCSELGTSIRDLRYMVNRMTADLNDAHSRLAI